MMQFTHRPQSQMREHNKSFCRGGGAAELRLNLIPGTQLPPMSHKEWMGKAPPVIQMMTPAQVSLSMFDSEMILFVFHCFLPPNAKSALWEEYLGDAELIWRSSSVEGCLELSQTL
jgi:hypothetical protein